jgi:hypothetical protein
MVVGEPIYLACLIPVVAAAYLIPGGRPRQLFLLTVSYCYYLTFPVLFFAILLAITGLAYFGALWVERTSDKRYGGAVLAILVVAALLPLGSFKYLQPLLLDTSHFEGANWQLSMQQIALPIGLSFYTFAALGYIIDVYLGVIAPAERNPVRVALFTSFFPYVTAGPIPRAPQMLPQLELCGRFNAEQAMQGVRQILLGVIMKFWIADSLAGPAAKVYANLATSIPLEKLVATVFFAFQIYTDFAGYSLIAIGSARLLGIDTPDNFRQPYLSPSIAEFWRRWHISLLTWLRDYVFSPIALHLRRFPAAAVPIAMFITLVLVGIWHGAGWGFLVFGVVHGALLAIGKATKRTRERILLAFAVPEFVSIPIQILITFSIVVLSLVLIRAQTLSQALAIYHDLLSPIMLQNLHDLALGKGDPFAFIHATENIPNIALIAAVIIGDIFARTKLRLVTLPSFAQGTVYAASVLTIFYQVISVGAPQLFVYFQF